MTRLSNEYRAQYEIVFQGDMSFSKRMMRFVQRILHGILLPMSISDNAGAPPDFVGHDLTIKPLQIGVRVRRHQFKRYGQFTQDDKERLTMSCDVYFFGYATTGEDGLDSYLVFDGYDYEKHRGTDLIPVRERCENRKHSLVPFNCYDLDDIIGNCEVYAMHNIARKGQLALF